MTELIPLAIPINAETLLAQAQAARVGAHIRTILARLKPRVCGNQVEMSRYAQSQNVSQTG